MAQSLDSDELVEHWTLPDDEQQLIAGKRGVGKDGPTKCHSVFGGGAGLAAWPVGRTQGARGLQRGAVLGVGRMEAPGRCCALGWAEASGLGGWLVVGEGASPAMVQRLDLDELVEHFTLYPDEFGLLRRRR